MTSPARPIVLVAKREGNGLSGLVASLLEGVPGIHHQLGLPVDLRVVEGLVGGGQDHGIGPLEGLDLPVVGGSHGHLRMVSVNDPVALLPDQGRNFLGGGAVRAEKPLREL